MGTRASHNLSRSIKTHGLRVKQRRRERCGVMAVDPGRDIDEVSEARSVALGKAILAETLDLVEAAFGELCRIAALRHATDHLLVQAIDGTAAAEGRHGAAK